LLFIVPRSFRLRQELEFAEKGASAEQKSNGQQKAKDPNLGWISFGIHLFILSIHYIISQFNKYSHFLFIRIININYLYI
jgi:hypothetical protein